MMVRPVEERQSDHDGVTEGILVVGPMASSQEETTIGDQADDREAVVRTTLNGQFDRSNFFGHNKWNELLQRSKFEVMEFID
uniref:Uncharacterized protein n=1 Tax=Oryza sativa subsp. japonica TaxID=39947 RepID=Q6H7N0_ORYSJ|nr:hypothetical protein [Oryza sativa Japonica Group]BAD25269.1 hypothetical protein [Oryza sativa Japonica Group]